jgi:hypothetical protein
MMMVALSEQGARHIRYYVYADMVPLVRVMNSVAQPDGEIVCRKRYKSLIVII